VAIDPAVTAGDKADETGLIVAGRADDGQVYVLHDATLRATPLSWAAKAVELYHEYSASEIVIETNNGGEALSTLLHQVDSSVNIKDIHAKKGKRVRAEPVSAMYEQHKIHHVGSFDLLEDQLCTWTPELIESPDRMDALVYAVLMLCQSPTYLSDFVRVLQQR